MPRLLEPVFYEGNQPYHELYDNLPIVNINTNLQAVNNALDELTAILNNASGTTGNISVRLEKSLNGDGSLITEAVDNTLHNIGAHTDGVFDDGDGPVEYVRMTKAERDKLTLIEDEANLLAIQFDTISNIVFFENGVIEIAPSETVSWTVQENEEGDSNVLQAHLAFPPEAAHRHYYDLRPAFANPVTPDYKHYLTTSLSTPFVEGSLRVHVNGMRIPELTPGVWVPPATGPDGTWRQLYFVSNADSGSFVFNIRLNTADVVRIDFDISFTS